MKRQKEEKVQKGIEEVKRIRKIYSKILMVLKAHKSDIVFDIENLEEQANVHILGFELKEKYGLNIDPKQIYSINYNRLGKFRYIVSYNEAKKESSCFFDVAKKIGKFDYLFVLDFPTGAFMFSCDGEEYPATFFVSFLRELETYNPDYVSSLANTLYWKLENAKEIFNSFESILNKYYELNEERIAKEKVVELEEKLKELKGKLGS